MLASRTLEYAFVIISLAAFIVSLYSLREAVIDETWLTTRGTNGPRKIVADANVREEGFKVAKTAVMVAASLLALFMAPPPPAYTELPQSFMFLIAWMIVGLLMIMGSLFSRLVRHRLYKYSEELNTANQTRRKDDAPSDEL